MKVKIKYQLNCKKCGHKWNPRKLEVRICPKCKSAYFDKERANAKKGQGNDGE